MKASILELSMNLGIPPHQSSKIASSLFLSLDDESILKIHNYYKRRLSTNVKDYGNDAKRDALEIFCVDFYCILSRILKDNPISTKFDKCLILLFDDGLSSKEIKQSLDFKVFLKFIDDYTLNLNGDNFAVDRLIKQVPVDEVFNESLINRLTRKLYIKYGIYTESTKKALTSALRIFKDISTNHRNYSPIITIIGKYNPDNYEFINFNENKSTTEPMKDSEIINAMKKLYTGNTVPDINCIDAEAFKILQTIFPNRFLVAKKKGEIKL